MKHIIPVAVVALGLAAAMPASAQTAAGAAATAASVDVAPRMTVVGSDRKFVGTVDAVEPNRIVLTRSDPVAQGQHHAVPRTAVAGVEGTTVVLGMTSDEAFRSWNAVPPPNGDRK